MSRSAVRSDKKAVSSNSAEVLTLTEAAAYLRVPDSEVVRLVQEQALPARKIGVEWRFLKSALQEWLSSPLSRKEALLVQIGAFKDDPELDDIVKEIYRQRGRPMTEEG